LKNNAVLILGATSDVALAFADLCAMKGHSLILAARRTEDLLVVKSDLEIRYNVPVHLALFDARSFQTHHLFYNSLPIAPGIIACFFGYLGNQAKAELDFEESLHIIEANYTGAVSILNIATGALQIQGEGTIIGVSSVAGERGRQSNYFYGSAKAGFTAYLSGLRNRLYAHGVHVITVLPGFIDTKMTKGLPLPKPLTAQPIEVAKDIYTALAKKQNVVYTKWFWRYIMLIIKLIPEPIFKKLKL
jgi:short-subunit dehydrogenase